ncbi:MAG: peptidoglycan-binding domain-containing protein [Boseongicola sp.]
MENGKLAATIGLIFLSASVAIPDKGHSADIFKELAKTLANKAIIQGTPQEAASAKQLNSANSRDEIRRDQAALKRNGYSPGPADGIDGNKTRAAVRAFQSDNGWPVTGVLTGAQRARLRGHIDPGAAAVASGLVPLILNDGGGSVTRSSDAVQERRTPVVLPGNGSGSAETSEISLRQQQRLSNERSRTSIEGTDNTGTTATATGSFAQDPTTTVGTSQQSLRSVLNNSAQQSTNDDSSTNSRKRVTSTTTTTTSVDQAAQRRQLRQDRTSVGSAGGAVAGSQATIRESATEGDCTNIKRRAGGCISQ